MWQFISQAFAGANLGVGFAKGSLPFPEAFHLGADQDESGFELVEEVVVVGGGAVLGDNLDALPVTLFRCRISQLVLS